MKNNIPLGVNIFLHILMDIKMIWRKIGNNRNIRTSPH